MPHTVEVILTQDTRDQLLALSRAAQPFECCGALLGECVLGSWWRVHSFLPLVNEAFDTRREYLISAEQVRYTERAAESRGLQLVGFYHSHPAGGSDASAMDLARSWPGYLYVIVGAVSGTIGTYTLDPDGREMRPLSSES